MMLRKTGEIPAAVMNLAKRAEEFNPKKIRAKAIFNVTIMIGAIIMAGIDLWIISQGLVETAPARKLAAFIVLGAAALFLVGLISLIALIIGTFFYQHLNLVVERAEKEEVVEEEGALIDAVAYALAKLDVRVQGMFVKALSESKYLQSRPGLVEEMKGRLHVVQ